MATNPKLKPCPMCGSVEDLEIWTYDAGYGGHGTQHVECDPCRYLGPASGSRRWAIKLHNEQYLASKAGAA